MLTKLLARFKFWKTELSLKELLQERSLRESLLGVDRKKPVIDEVTKSDAARIVNYSKSDDYAIYVQELWETVCQLIKTLSDENLKSEDANFYRGMLASTLDCLRISYKAKAYMESLIEKPVVKHRDIVPPRTLN